MAHQMLTHEFGGLVQTTAARVSCGSLGSFSSVIEGSGWGGLNHLCPVTSNSFSTLVLMPEVGRVSIREKAPAQ